MQRRRSTEVNRTFHDVWPSPALVHYIYIFRGCFPVMEFCHVHELSVAGNAGRKNIAKNSPSGHHRTTLSGYICAIKACIDNRKKLLNSNICSTCPHNMANFGRPLTAEIGSGIWGIPAKFNGFRVLDALLHGPLVVGATYIWQGGHHVGHWPTF